MDGQIGAISEGLEADLICVDGDPSTDVTVLGETSRIRYVMVRGELQDLSPLPPRRPISGWRVAMIGSQLTRDIAFGQ